MENTFHGDDGERYKPDIAALTDRSVAYIIDIKCRFEKEDYLEMASTEKIVRYSRITSSVKEEFNAIDVKILPIVVGC